EGGVERARADALGRGGRGEAARALVLSNARGDGMARRGCPRGAFERAGATFGRQRVRERRALTFAWPAFGGSAACAPRRPPRHVRQHPSARGLGAAL